MPATRSTTPVYAPHLELLAMLSRAPQPLESLAIDFGFAKHPLMQVRDLIDDIEDMGLAVTVSRLRGVLVAFVEIGDWDKAETIASAYADRTREK